MRLVLTIDTEAEGQWEAGSPVTTVNARYWPRFQELFESHGAIPTYLLTSEIVEDDLARDLLSSWLRRDSAHVGSHLHPWTTAPYVDSPGLRYNDEIHAYPSQLPPALLDEKLGVLTQQIETALGRSPTLYRAGRFGFDARCARVLRAHGYKLDTSVTPYVSWRPSAGLNGVGGPDFSRLSPHPFRVQGDDPGLLELPVTIVPTYALLRAWPVLLRAYRGLPGRAMRKLLPSGWLRNQPAPLNPSPENGLRGLEQVWSAAAAAHIDIAVMMFHSSELMPGGTPYRPTPESVVELFDCMHRFFTFVRSQGGQFMSLAAAASELAVRDDLETRPL